MSMAKSNADTRPHYALYSVRPSVRLYRAFGGEVTMDTLTVEAKDQKSRSWSRSLGANM